MKIKRILASVLAAAMVATSGIGVFAADSIPGNTWEFENNGTTDLPAGFSWNNKKVVLYNNAGAKGLGKSLGFLPVPASENMGKGDGVLKTTSNGVRIDASDYVDVEAGVAVISYDFMIENENLNALLIAPVLESGADLTDSVQIKQIEVEKGKFVPKIVIRDEEIATISKNVWYNVAAKYNFTAEGVTMDVYFDGAPQVKNIVLPETYNAGFSSFAVLTSPKTRADENFLYNKRNEILNMDNLYIGQDTTILLGVFKLEAVKQVTENGIDVIFNRPAKIEEMTEDVVKNLVKAYTVTTEKVDEKEQEVLKSLAVSAYSWKEEGKVLSLTLQNIPKPGTTVEISISPELISDEGVAYTGDATKRVVFKVPNGVNMFWSFDEDGANMPAYFNRTNATNPPPFNASNTGMSGKANDKCFGFLPGIGVGSHGLEVTTTKYTHGFKVFKNSDLSAPNNDITMIIDYDFMPSKNYMEGWLVMPGWGIGEAQSLPVTYWRDQTIKFGEEVIGTYEAEKWQNIGVVYHLSSTEGTTMDVWYNGIKKISGYNTGRTDGITSFAFNVCAPHDTSKDTSNRFDGRGESFSIDNLYIGTDMSYLMDSILVESATPTVNAEDVAVDTPISVTLNDKATNGNANGLISLETKAGEKVALKNFEFAENNYVINAEFDGVLNYREEYKVTISKDILSQYGYHPLEGAGYSFKTGSAYPAELIVSDFTKADGTATANVEFVGDEALLVMASYDANGTMIAATTATASGAMSVSCPDGATVQVFAIDSLANGTLLAEPFIEGDTASGYYQNATTISLTDAETADRIISVLGSSNLKNAYVFAKIAKAEKDITSDSADDYLSFGVARTDAKGEFAFNAYVEQKEGTYKYSVKASDMAEAANDEVEYNVQTGNSIESIKLENASCKISGSEITLTTSKSDRSGMLVNFVLSDGASIYVGDEKLESGKSRINANETVTLTVVSEWKDEKEYTLKVTKKSNSSSGGGGGGSSSSNISISIPSGTQTLAPSVADPYVEEAPQIFEDVSKDHWASKAIENLFAKKVVSGISETAFEPEREITRQEFAVLLQNAFNFSAKGKRLSFDDVKHGDWYADAVYLLADNEIVSGVGNHIFGVGQKITRQDMAVMIYRCVKDKLPEKTKEYTDFADEAEIAEYAKEAVTAMYECGVINGMGEGTFQPSGSATRAQAAFILNQLIG